jgi:hypothetical protein
MRVGLVALWMLLFSLTPATAQVSVGIGFPGVSIGINLPSYPQLVRVPGYPVYYAPSLNSNFFFYDGMYWVYQGDNWYASSWYNGPWGLVAPAAVPLFILRVPVRYYRQPPVYFGGWRTDAPPRWGDHWGHEWEQGHSGWDRWNRSSAPTPAPLPSYQRQYAGDRYPQAEQQNVLRSQNYRYQPRDVVVREHYQQQGAQSAPAAAQRSASGGPAEKSARPPQSKHSNAAPQLQQGSPSSSRPPSPQGSPPNSRPPPSHGAAPQEQQKQGSQAPGKNPKADKPKHEKNADKGEQQDQGPRK